MRSEFFEILRFFSTSKTYFVFFLQNFSRKQIGCECPRVFSRLRPDFGPFPPPYFVVAQLTTTKMFHTNLHQLQPKKMINPGAA